MNTMGCASTMKKTPARLEEVGNHPRPPVEVREPAQHAVRRKHTIELPSKMLRKIIEITVDEGGGGPYLTGQGGSGLDRLRGEIGARHSCPTACPGEGIEAEVTLEMQQGLATDVAEPCQRNRVERLSPRLEALDVVKPRGDVEGCPASPECLIGGAI
jgi:hypothetical protein